MTRVAMQVVVGIALVGAGYAVGRAQGTVLKSAVVTEAQTTVGDSGAWGTFHKHFGGATPATSDVLSGIVDLKPGSEPHPPHQHADEEFVYIVEGSGTWSLNGKTLPAKKGDVMYTAPNDLHGIKAGPSTPLRFFFAKWRTR